VWILRGFNPFGFEQNNFFENERDSLAFAVAAPNLRQRFSSRLPFPQSAFVQIQKHRGATRRDKGLRFSVN